MRSIVTCPGCQRRLRMNVGQTGKKHRCPACSTPFVLGARTNEGAVGDAEFLAFEVFDEEVVSEGLEIVAPPSKPSRSKGPVPKPRPKAVVKKPAFNQHVPNLSGKALSDRFEPVFDNDEKVGVDFELKLDLNERKDSLLPDDFGIVDESEPEPPAPPVAPPPVPDPSPPKPTIEYQTGPRSFPKLPAPVERKPPQPPTQPVQPAPAVEREPEPRLEPPPVFQQRPGPVLSPNVELEPEPAPPAVKPRVEPAPPAPKSVVARKAEPMPAPPEPPFPQLELPAKDAAAANTTNADLSLPETFLNQPKPESSVPDDDLKLPDDFSDYLEPQKPVSKSVPKPPPPPPPAAAKSAPAAKIVETGLEIVKKPEKSSVPTRRAANTGGGFTVISRPSDPPTVDGVVNDVMDLAEQASLAIVPPSVPVDYGDDYDNQAAYRPPRDEKPTRENWLFAFWGITAVMAGLALDVGAIILFIFSALIGWLGFEAGTFAGFAMAGVVIAIAVGLLMFQQGVSFLGYALCLGSPAKGTARMWAMLTMAMALVGVAASGLHFVIGRHSWVALGVYPTVTLVELVKWVFFLIYLIALGKALRNRSVEEDVINTLKMTIAVIVVDFFVILFGIVATPLIVRATIETGEYKAGFSIAMIVGVLTWVIIIGSVVLVLIRQIVLLLHVRDCIRSRIERM